MPFVRRQDAGVRVCWCKLVYSLKQQIVWQKEMTFILVVAARSNHCHGNEVQKIN